jgi:hypothetical protein
MRSKRLLLFLFGCIGMRIILAYSSKKIPADYLPYLGIITLAIGIGLFYYYFSGKRKTGPETFGDEIWWNDLRPLHGSLYILFSLLAFQKCSYAWIVLALDTFIGLTAFLIFHHKKGDLNLK